MSTAAPAATRHGYGYTAARQRRGTAARFGTAARGGPPRHTARPAQPDSARNGMHAMSQRWKGADREGGCRQSAGRAQYTGPARPSPAHTDGTARHMRDGSNGLIGTALPGSTARVAQQNDLVLARPGRALGTVLGLARRTGHGFPCRAREH